MTTLTAAELIQLLAEYIEKHGNAPVAMPWHGYADNEYEPVVRCWWNDERNCVVIGGH